MMRGVPYKQKQRAPRKKTSGSQIDKGRGEFAQGPKINDLYGPRSETSWIHP